MSLEIPLTFRRQDFEEIYFKDKQGSYIHSPTVKAYFISFFGALLLLILTTSYALKANNNYLIIPVFILFLIASIGYVRAIWTLYKWKKEVSKFLDREEQYENYLLVLTNEAFSLIQDDSEHIEKWESIKNVDISDQYLIIGGKQDFLIPMKSVGENSYQELRKIVSKNVK